MPVPESMFCDILWAKNLVPVLTIPFFSDFLFVLVYTKTNKNLICFRFSFYIVSQNLFECSYSFSIAFCFSFSISYSLVILLHFDSVLVLVIVKNITGPGR